MNLAEIIFVVFFSASPLTMSQQTAAPAQAPPAPSASTPAQPSPTHTPPTLKRRHRKKKVSTNCDRTPAASGQSPTAAADPVLPSNCPPPTIVVRQGGASDPSIQVVGPPKSSQHDADQMLATTNANLKKIDGNKITPAQQDIVSQIHQYIDQSKAAVDAGDLDRARTLAWKAQVLTEDLLKPEKKN